MILFAIILGLFPSFAWLFFFLREDSKNPEPRNLIVYVFVAGAAVTLIAIYAELFFQNAITSIGFAVYGAASMLGLAFIEEFFKFGAVYLTVRKRAEFDEPVDAMIYMVVAALGFAAVENIAAVSGVFKGTASLADIFQITTLRFIGATLLHSLASAALGYYWALGIAKNKVVKFIAIGLIMATLLHALFNYLILSFEPEFYPTLFLVALALFIFVDFEKLKRV